MAFDAFVIFSGGPTKIQGESQDSVFGPKQAIEISEFSFGAETTINISSATGGAGAGKATFKEFKVKKLTDTASPSLLQCLGQGDHYSKVQLYLRKSGSAAAEGKSGKSYLVFAFGMVAVKTIDWSGSTGDDAPTEEVVFEYGEMFMGYYPQFSGAGVGTATSGTGGGLGTLCQGAWSKLLNSKTPKLVNAGDVSSL